jgi:septal ring factor EnvC (AmiA/AmiB activator)
VDYDPHMEARIANIEAHLARIDVAIEYMQRDIKEIKEVSLKEMKEEIRALRLEHRSDFRVLVAAILTLAIGMAGTMARVFGLL